MAESEETQTPGSSQQPSLKLVITINSFKTANLAIKYGFPSWAFVQAIKLLAGKKTVAMFFVELLKPEHTSYIILGALIAILFIWGFAERSLRQNKTAALQGRIRDLEARLDPHRSSSSLTRHGKTNPEDLT